jgi:hypothetical protein
MYFTYFMEDLKKLLSKNIIFVRQGHGDSVDQLCWHPLKPELLATGKYPKGGVIKYPSYLSALKKVPCSTFGLWSHINGVNGEGPPLNSALPVRKHKNLLYLKL